jgi:hypothetical protein
MNIIKANRNYFQFKLFEELRVGEVFKFSPIIDLDLPDVFYTVFAKNELNTLFNSTYGKQLNTMIFSNNSPREVMVYPYRKK